MAELIKAQGKYIGRSPRKIRLVADAVRGMNATLALASLKYMRKGGALDVYKVVASAVANATHNNKLNANELVITKIFIDEAPMYKRAIAQSKGRSRRILKRNSHITVIVSVPEKEQPKKEVAKAAKAEKPAEKKVAKKTKPKKISTKK